MLELPLKNICPILLMKWNHWRNFCDSPGDISISGSPLSKLRKKKILFLHQKWICLDERKDSVASVTGKGSHGHVSLSLLI